MKLLALKAIVFLSFVGCSTEKESSSEVKYKGKRTLTVGQGDRCGNEKWILRVCQKGLQCLSGKNGRACRKPGAGVKNGSLISSDKESNRRLRTGGLRLRYVNKGERCGREGTEYRRCHSGFQCKSTPAGNRCKK